MQKPPRTIALPAPWKAILLPVLGFPLAKEDRIALDARVEELLGPILQGRTLEHHVLLQLWNLGPATGGDVLAQHVSEWQPEFGMGVWPNREGPMGWTEPSLMDAAAAVMQGDEPDMPNHRLLHLTTPDSTPHPASACMRGFGTLIQFFSSVSFERIAADARSLYLDRVTEARFQAEPFYLPLMDVRALQSANSAQQISDWLCGIDCYVRDSGEDRGVLIVLQDPW